MGDTSFFISIVVRRRLFGGGAYSETALIQRRRSNEQIRFTGWYPELVSVSALVTGPISLRGEGNHGDGDGPPNMRNCFLL